MLALHCCLKLLTIGYLPKPEFVLGRPLKGRYSVLVENLAVV